MNVRIKKSKSKSISKSKFIFSNRSTYALVQIHDDGFINVPYFESKLRYQFLSKMKTRVTINLLNIQTVKMLGLRDDNSRIVITWYKPIA